MFSTYDTLNFLLYLYFTKFLVFCFFLLICLYKAIEHLVHPTYASPVVTGDTGAHNVGLPSSNLDQLSAGTFSPTVSPTNPVQDSVESDGDAEDCSDENQLIEVQFFYFNKGEAAYSSSSCHSVRGHLKVHISFWRRLQASAFILSTIHDGYKIPFLSTSPRFWCKDNRSSLDNCDFVTEAIQDLIQDEKITEANSSDLSNINPLSVSIQPCGKKRLILDLRLINQHLDKFKFKYEDYKKALEYFEAGGFAINFDLKSGFHHLDICPHHRQYLGFAWIFPDGRERFFMFNVLPFGLSSAPRRGW